MHPDDRRGKVVAVRFTKEEWARLDFETRIAAGRGVRVSPSDLIRKAVRFYGLRLSQAQIDEDYPKPRPRRSAR
jgi:hypothetical protein